MTSDLVHDVDDKMDLFSRISLGIATGNIPKTSPISNRKAKPLFDEDC